MAAATFFTPAAVAPPGQPDIAYAPDFEKYQARVDRRQKTEKLSKQLPPGFPAELKGELVWDGRTLAESYNWTYTLDADQLAEVDSAVTHFKCKSSCLSNFSFPFSLFPLFFFSSLMC